MGCKEMLKQVIVFTEFRKYNNSLMSRVLIDFVQILSVFITSQQIGAFCLLGARGWHLLYCSLEGYLAIRV